MLLKELDQYLTSHIYFIINSEFILFGVLIILMVIKKIFNIMRDYVNNQLVLNYQKILSHIFLLDTDHTFITQIKKIPKNDSFRDYLALISSRLTPRDLVRVRRIYVESNFYQNDLKNLGHARSFKRLSAIDRLEKLGLEIPLEIYQKLLNDQNYMVRYVAMLHFIQIKPREVLFPLISYINDKRYEKKGLLLHTISVFGRKDPEGVSFLFKRTNSVDLEIALLAVAQLNPPRGLDQIIYRKVQINSPVKILVESLKVLKFYPSLDLKKLVFILASHSRWEVKLFALRTLDIFDFELVKGLIRNALIDQNFLIRLEASKLLLHFDQKGYFEAQYIKDDLMKTNNHPSHKLLVHLEGIRAIEVQAS